MIAPKKGEIQITEQLAQHAETKCTEAQQELVNKGHSEARISGQKQALVPQKDSAVTNAECSAAKLSHKQNNKRILQDTELTSVINAWPDLPEPVKVGILAMVKAATQPDKDGADGAS